jgi:hypothetical protein
MIMLFGACFVLKVEWIVAVATSLTIQFESCGLTEPVTPLSLSGCLAGPIVGEARATSMAGDPVPGDTIEGIVAGDSGDAAALGFGRFDPAVTP